MNYLLSTDFLNEAVTWVLLLFERPSYMLFCSIFILGSKLDIQPKQSHQIFSVDVPIYRPGPTLDKLNERLRDVYQKLSQDNLRSVAVSIDNIGSWEVGGFVPRVIRSFSAFLLEKGKQIQLAVLLCSTDTDSINKAKNIIQPILKEEFGKEESCRKGKIRYFLTIFIH